MKNIDSANPNTNSQGPKIEVSDKPQGRPSVNLVTARQKSKPKKTVKRIFLFTILLIIILGTGIVLRAANLSSKIFVGQKTTFWEKVVDVIRGGGDNARLEGEDIGQINILILGIGGEGHDGPYLTDTMILAQIRPDIGAITLTSIPRDYLVDLPNNGGQDKINSAFTYGYITNKDWDQGGELAREVVQNISGLKIPYFAVLDFSGFEQAINEVGGVDVTIDNTFTDYTYPDSGTGYLPPITFTKGSEHMDGTRALEFARSRHAAGIEGSDFARSLRQQKIIQAFKQKILSLNLIKDAASLNNLLSIFADHFHTNLTPAQSLRIFNLIKNSGSNIQSLSLDPDTGLICPEILASNGAYVLTPCPGKSTEDVENYFKNSFSISKISAEQSTVWLASSTGDKAAYNTAVHKLAGVGITPLQLGYSQDNLPQTTIYEVTPKPATAEFLANELNGTIVNLPPPGVHVTPGKVDVIVVLGQNAPVEAAPAPYIAPPARIDTTTTSSITNIATPTSTLPTIATTTPAATSTKPKK